MTEQARAELESKIRRACLKEDFTEATTLALRGYGPEVFGFLMAFLREEADASEVFSLFSERVWRGLPSFDWASSFRTWAYAIARNTSVTYRTASSKRARRFPPLPEESGLAEIAAEVRSQTLSFLKTAAKDRIAAFRAELSPEDQMLLSLRLDRKLQWLELAQIMRDEETPATAEELKRESAKLRQRFHAIKEKLVALQRREIA